MPSFEERLRHVHLKISRAKEHIAELERKLNDFYAGKPYRVGAKRDIQTQKLIYYVVSVEPTPDVIPLIAGDAIQNLMSALDHLAYQLVCKDTEDNPPNPNWIYFPIADDFTKYQDKKHGKMQGACAETFDAIDALHPYKGGNDTLWSLYRLNNIEKHRLLLTVGSQAAGINLGQLGISQMRNIFPEEAIAAFESMNIFINPANKGFPLQAGYELYIGAVDEQPNPKQEFRFQVALNETGIVEGKSVLESVNQFLIEVERIVGILKTRLQ